MPYYNFVCRQCEKEFEVKVAIADKDQVKCPACDAEKPRQVFSNVGLVKKSSGGDSVGAACGGCQNRQFG